VATGARPAVTPVKGHVMYRFRAVTLHGCTISHGNQKVGHTANVSLLPGASCPDDIPCKRDCYEAKALRMYPTVRRARQRNWKLWRSDPDSYFRGIREYLTRYTPKWFRWHVGGDIPSQDYYTEMKKIAREFPGTNFLCFTKNHDLSFAGRPQNLAIILSMWPGWGSTRKDLPRAWMQDGTETRIPDSAIPCTGSCENCGMCWSLPVVKKDVVFNLH